MRRTGAEHRDRLGRGGGVEVGPCATLVPAVGNRPRLAALTDSAFVLTRGSAGIDRHKRLDLANITDTIVAARTHEAQHLGIHVSTSLSAATCTGDPRLAERLIANLVDNALRHNTPDGHVDIRTLTRSGQAVLSISNTGPAIPADAIGGLFQPFRRLHPDRTGGSDGVGLGLSIAPRSSVWVARRRLSRYRPVWAWFPVHGRRA